MAFIQPKQLISSSIMLQKMLNWVPQIRMLIGLFGSKFGHSMALAKFDISFERLASILFQRNRIFSSEYLYFVPCMIAAPMRWRTQYMNYGAANCYRKYGGRSRRVEVFCRRDLQISRISSTKFCYSMGTTLLNQWPTLSGAFGSIETP